MIEGVRSPPGRKIRVPGWVLGLVGALTLAIAAAVSDGKLPGINVSPQFLPSPEQRIVESAFQRTMTATLMDQVVLPDELPSVPGGPERHWARVNSMLTSTLTGNELDYERGPLEAIYKCIPGCNGPNPNSPDGNNPSHWTDAGVASIYFSTVIVNGDHALVDANVRVWFRWSGTGRIPPTNGLHDVADMVRSGDQWKVSHLSWNFLPGEGP